MDINLVKIFLIGSYHYFIHNGLEKLFFQTYFDYDDIKRPLKICKKTNDKNDIMQIKLSCTGLPSGHAESFTIVILLLYLYKYMNCKYVLPLIFLVGLQRIVVKKHTLLQVVLGTFLGFVYTLFYSQLNMSFI